MSVKEEDTFAVKEEEVSESAEVPVPVCRSCNNHPCVLEDVESMLQDLFDTYAGTLKNNGEIQSKIMTTCERREMVDCCVLIRTYKT